MKKYTRKEFLGWGAGLAGASFLPAPQDGREADPAASAVPDLIVIRGRVYTLEEDYPRAEAFAVKAGRIVAVGSSSEIRSLAGDRTEIVDAAGMTILPGFIDAHTHPSSNGVAELVYVSADLRRIADIQQALRERASRTPPGEWVIGFKYDDTKLQDGRPLHRKDLDAAVPEHPVVVRHRGGHTAVYNSRAFALAGVRAETPDPPGGKFYRQDGELTGLVAEKANEVFQGLIPSQTTREQRRQGVKFILEKMAAAGLTSVQDASTGSDGIVAYQDALHANELPLRVYMMISGNSPAYQGLKEAGIYTGFGNEWLRVGGVKFFADGSASERTMRMSTPFVGRPDDYGILTMTQEEIQEVVEEAHRRGFQVGIHANGDVAIDMVLKAYERVQARWPRPDPRHRLEHCSLVNPDLLKRIKAVGAIPTPFYTYVYYHGDKWGEYGEEKMRWMFAHRSFLDYGIRVAAASDYVPGPFEPLMAIQSMVTRRDYRGRVWGPNQRITVEEALRICTVYAARASFEESLKGTLRAGKLADFVFLGADPHETDPEAIREIPVLRTVVGGKTVYSAEG